MTVRRGTQSPGARRGPPTPGRRCAVLSGAPLSEAGPCSLGTGEGCVGTGQLSALLCSSASDFRGTRVGRLRPSGSTGDLLVASPGCAQALRRLRGCAEVTPPLEIEMGPWEPTTCDLHVAWALVLVLPPTRSLPRPLTAPVSLPVGRGDEGCALEPRADSERSRGPGGQPRPGCCRLHRLPASSPLLSWWFNACVAGPGWDTWDLPSSL